MTLAPAPTRPPSRPWVRLPGVQFETVSPPPDDVLPRMDLAVLVGFASSGPLHTPVAVEDAAQFVAIFGGDAPLAWDEERGERLYAYLAPAVRAFFRNGGRRCWVVRVAGPARANLFPVPGLLRVGPGVPAPAFAQAASEGSWSDGLRVGASLLSQPLAVAALSTAHLTLDLLADSPGNVAVGDLLRVTFADSGHVLFLVVQGGTTVASDASPQPVTRLMAGQPAWFASRAPAGAAAPSAAFLFADEGAAAGSLDPEVADPPKAGIAVLDQAWPQPDPDSRQLTVDLALPLSAAPGPGSLVRIDGADAQLWLTVQAAQAPQDGTVRLAGQGLWRLAGPPATVPVLQPTDTVERLTFQLSAWQTAADPVSLSDLGFAAGHPRFWAALPTDRERYRRTGPSGASWATSPAPLAGCGPRSAVYVPVAMPSSSDLDQALGPAAAVATPLERDGLARFGPELFLDSALAATGATDLLKEADFLRYQSPQPRDLTGIHAALSVEEATLIAVPDAPHRGWWQRPHQDPPPAAASPPLGRPEWWHARPCAGGASVPLVREPAWGSFLDLGTRVVDPPTLASGQPDRTGSFGLSWSTVSGATYLVEESATPDFAAAVAVYAGPETRLTVYGRGEDDYYFRVRAVVGAASSDWSNGAAVRVGQAGDWLLKAVADYAPDTLLAVHGGLLRVCAARGDLLAVLAVPEHYRDDMAAGHAAALGQPGPGETGVSSYGALYYPWLVARDGDSAGEPRRTPPDGAVCGLLAQVALARGAWIAPATTPLRDVVALDPPATRERWLGLLQAGANVIRQDPRGFVPLSADTLSDDPDLGSITVRRLLILLRRLAQRLGPAYVFEPNDPSFRRSLQYAFEGMLDLLFARGALAGAVAAEAFQVVVSAAGAQPGRDEGQLVVELRVAPSRPLTFLTVRLLQTSTGAVLVEAP